MSDADTRRAVHKRGDHSTFAKGRQSSCTPVGRPGCTAKHSRALASVPVGLHDPPTANAEEHMGTWDDGPFDNDTAADWCDDLHDADPSARSDRKSGPCL